MSSSSSNNNNPRKRNRWGDNTQPNHNNNQRTVAVSDQEALEALLASSKSKAKEQAPPPQHSNRERKPYSQKKPRRDNNNNNNKQDDDKNNYYGHPEAAHDPDGEEAPVDKEKPNFGLSGALAQEQIGDLKFREPPEARAPNTRWRLYVFKNDEAIETLHIAKQSAYLFGRNQELADVPILHPSASGQHAVLQYRALPRKEDGKVQCKPYLMDLESTNGSFLNGVRIDPRRYYELRKGDVLKFGASTREYVLLTENTTAIK